VPSVGGWVASKRATPPEPRPLGGASMFVTAEQQHGWTASIPV
jgi:hypothetical protein